MPDLRSIQDYGDTLYRLEARYQRELKTPLKDTRSALLEALLRDPAYFDLLARREFDNLARQVSGIAGGLGGPTEAAALELTGAQLAQLERVFTQTPGLGQVSAATAAGRSELLASAGQAASLWVEGLAAQFLLELARLKQAEETVQAMVERLLAEDLAGGRASAWRNGLNAAEVQSQRGLWTLGNSITGLLYRAGESLAGQTYERQAIAALDERTTDCCLRVHGQIVGIKENFHLVGTPRFADEMPAPPFHWFCRTSVALYVRQFEDFGITTAEMRDAARAELAARADGSRVEIHPASATSRRR